MIDNNYLQQQPTAPLPDDWESKTAIADAEERDNESKLRARLDEILSAKDPFAQPGATDGNAPATPATPETPAIPATPSPDAAIVPNPLPDTDVKERAADGTIVDTITSLPSAVGKDVVRGLSEAPRKVARGVIMGFNEISNLAGYLPDLSWRTDTGEPLPLLSRPEITTYKTAVERVNKGRKAAGANPVPMMLSPQLPVPAKAKQDSVTGDILEYVSQFAVGAKGLGKVAKIAKGKGFTEGAKILTGQAGIGSRVVQGAGAEMIAFASDSEQRLSNVLAKNPSIVQPVAQFLAANEDDTVVERKLKQALEGAATNVVSEAFIKSLKFIRGIRKVNPEAQLESEMQGAVKSMSEEQINAQAFSELGDVNNEALYVIQPKAAAPSFADKLKASAQQVAGITPQEVKKPLPPTGAEEIQINFNRINTSDDIKNLISQMANDSRLISGVQNARRGVQSFKMTKIKARDINGFDELIGRRQGEAFNAEQITAARFVWHTAGQKLIQIAKKASTPTATEVDHFNFRKMMEVYNVIQQEVLGVRAEAGRALAAFRIEVGQSGVTNKQLDEVLQGFGGVEPTKLLAQKITALDNIGEVTPEKLAIIAKGAWKARTYKAMESLWVKGLLTNPATHVANLESNWATGFLMGAERATKSLISGSDTNLEEALQFFYGFFQSHRQAISNASQAFKTGETGMGLGKIDESFVDSSSLAALDPTNSATGANWLLTRGLAGYGAVLNKFSTNLLAAGDEFGKTIIYNAELRAQAYREGINQGLQGQELKKFIVQAITDPTDKIRTPAIEMAKYATYNKALDGAAKDFQKLMRYPLARVIVPFVRTPINIFKFTYERTPLALLSKNIRNDLNAGGVRQAEAQTRIATGTFFMMMSVDGAFQGYITGKGPTDPKIRQNWIDAGNQPYSFKNPMTGKFVSYARLEPFATWFGLGADMATIMTNGEYAGWKDHEDVDELATAAIVSMANQVLGKSFLQGVIDFTQFLGDPERYAKSFLEKLAGSVVPSAVAGMERVVSPEVEQVLNMRDAIFARIPGASDYVPKKYDAWGGELKSFWPGNNWLSETAGATAYQMFNPHKYPTGPVNEISQYLLENDLPPPNIPNKTQTFTVVQDRKTYSAAVDLRDYEDIYSEFLQLRGAVVLPQYDRKTLPEYVASLINEQSRNRQFFRQKTLEEQQKILTDIYSDYDSAIRQELVKRHDVLQNAIIKEAEKNITSDTAQSQERSINAPTPFLTEPIVVKR